MRALLITAALALAAPACAAPIATYPNANPLVGTEKVIGTQNTHTVQISASQQSTLTQAQINAGNFPFTHGFTIGGSSVQAFLAAPVQYNNVIGQGIPVYINDRISVTGVGPASTAQNALSAEMTAPANGGGFKVGIYGAAKTGLGTSDIWGANMLAQWNLGDTDVSVIGLEVDLNNNGGNAFTKAKNGQTIVSGGNFVGGIGLLLQNSIPATNEWSTGIYIDGSLRNGVGPFDGYLFRRRTDTAPQCSAFRAVDAANTYNLFYADCTGNVYAFGRVQASYARITATTYSNLTTVLDPTPAEGDRATITDDSNACTFMTAAAGGGATHCPLVYIAGAWKAG